MVQRKNRTSQFSLVMNQLYSRLVRFVFEFVCDFSVVEIKFGAAGQ